MKKFVFVSVIFFASFACFSQDPVTFGEEETVVEYFLGFSLTPSYSTILEFYIVYAPNNIVKEKKTISKTTFLAYATGTTKNSANPNLINMFEKYGIKNEKTIDDLWRLRYKTYPFLTSGEYDTKGWSNNDSFPLMPTPKQLELLNQYGINKIYDVCWGENCFKLIKALENQAWVDKYKSTYYQED